MGERTARLILGDGTALEFNGVIDIVCEGQFIKIKRTDIESFYTHYFPAVAVSVLIEKEVIEYDSENEGSSRKRILS